MKTQLDLIKTENAYYLLRSLERTVKESLDIPRLAATTTDMHEFAIRLKSDAIPIRRTFPLFAQYLWRIAGLLQLMS
jgi:hypothetical protein